jgi:hypothetical protein
MPHNYHDGGRKETGISASDPVPFERSFTDDPEDRAAPIAAIARASVEPAPDGGAVEVSVAVKKEAGLASGRII